MSNIGGGRLLRVCDLCGGVDDHPRHVLAGGTPDVYGPPAEAIIAAVLDNTTDCTPAERARLLAELADRSSQDRHFDCCRQAGCPDGSCNRADLAGTEHLRGADLLDHLNATREAIQ